MKKQNKIFMLAIALLVLPVLVKADMGAPEIDPYEAYVNKPVKVECYDREGDKTIDIPYNKKITISYEFKDRKSGIIYGDFEYNDLSCRIKINDITVVDDKEVLPDKEMEEFIDDIEILKEAGVKMHAEPAEAYKTVGETIPKGTTVKMTVGYIWGYTEYNGVKGWISILDGNVGFEGKDTYITSRDMKIIDENDKVLGTIPSKTILNKNDYYEIDSWSRTIYVKDYNGVSGYLDYGAIIGNYKNTNIVIKNNVNLYDNFNGSFIYDNYDIESKVIGEIRPNTKLISDYHVEHYFYHVEYDGKEGWISLDDLSNDSEVVTEGEENNENEPNENEPEESTETPKIEKEQNKISFNGIEMVVICIGGAVIIALTSLVTIVLINKKSKKKEELKNDIDKI